MYTVHYRGREAEELSQFTQEIFQLSLGFLERSFFGSQVGAVYLLYALFRNQIMEHSIRIRLNLFHWEIIKKLYILSTKNGYKSLHYVTIYLLKNAFDFVALPNLHSPLSGKGKAEIEQSSFRCEGLLNDVKTALSDFIGSNLLQNTKSLFNDYEELKKKIFKKSDQTGPIKHFSKYIEQLDALGSSGGVATRTRSRKAVSRESPDIGSRRAKIKAASFSKKAAYWQRCLKDAAGDDEDEQVVPSGPRVRVRRKRRRPPQHERRVGRPRKATAAQLEQMLLEEDEERLPAAGAASGARRGRQERRREASGKMAYGGGCGGYEALLAEIPENEIDEYETYSSSSDGEIEPKVEDYSLL